MTQRYPELRPNYTQKDFLLAWSGLVRLLTLRDSLAQNEKGRLTLVQEDVKIPNAEEKTAVIWTAQTSGNKDGVPYEQGDVLVSSNVGGVSKTKILMDWSTT